ncbi:MAG: hypothetical protein QM664_08170, partial [Flavihumibacter sp.]
MLQTTMLFLSLLMMIGTPAPIPSPVRQTNAGFPESWFGKWKGDMVWYQGKQKQQTIPMQLLINKTDSADQYAWHLVYGEGSKDSRPYTLKPYDRKKGHWLVDEHNSIVLDLFEIGPRL